MWRAESLEKTLMLGKIEGKRKRGWQKMRWLDSIANSTDMNLSKLRVIMKDREDWRAAVHWVTKSQTWFSDWTTTTQLEYQVTRKELVTKVSSSAWKWKVKVKTLSHVCLFATPWTAAHQAPPSMGFSRQKYWSGVPLPSPKCTLVVL